MQAMSQRLDAVAQAHQRTCRGEAQADGCQPTAAAAVTTELAALHSVEDVLGLTARLEACAGPSAAPPHDDAAVASTRAALDQARRQLLRPDGEAARWLGPGGWRDRQGIR